jgi:hypothetical protein
MAEAVVEHETATQATSFLEAVELLVEQQHRLALVVLVVVQVCMVQAD